MIDDNIASDIAHSIWFYNLLKWRRVF